jgi:hypothetical protein
LAGNLQLHAEVKSDTPRPYGGFWEAYREIISALIRQVRDPSYFVKCELPPNAGWFGPPAAVAAEWAGT